jgi:hypothetical protein
VRLGFLSAAVFVSSSFAVSLQANTIISTSGQAGISTLISSRRAVWVSWTASQSYSDVSISVFIDSSFPGETPSATAYLTTQIGPGTTALGHEIASAMFTVPSVLPVCLPGICGATVTVLSGLTLGPGTYFLTLGSDAPTSPVVGWFPIIGSFSTVSDSGVTLSSVVGTTGFSGPVVGYPPGNLFEVNNFFGLAQIFEVTGTPVPVPEPGAGYLVGLGVAMFFARLKTSS